MKIGHRICQQEGDLSESGSQRGATGGKHSTMGMKESTGDLTIVAIFTESFLCIRLCNCNVLKLIMPLWHWYLYSPHFIDGSTEAQSSDLPKDTQHKVGCEVVDARWAANLVCPRA